MIFRDSRLLESNYNSSNTTYEDTPDDELIDTVAAEPSADDDDEKRDPKSAAIVINNYDPSKKSDINNKDIPKDLKQSEQFTEAINKYMDFRDFRTNEELFNLDEAGQNTLLVSLTNKLYQMMVKKVDHIDYGDIPRTRGNITKLPKYDDIVKCLDILKNIFKQFHEDTKIVEDIESALNYIADYDDLFEACYAAKIELGIAMYQNMALAVISSISYLIAVCIEYVKSTKSEGLEVILDRAAVTKVKESLLYDSLRKFNDAARKGDVENTLKPLIKTRSKGLAALGTIAFTLAAGAVVLGLILASVSLIRDVVYYFYATRARFSQYLDIQADLLEMNAQVLADNDSIKTEGDKKAVIRRQLAIAAKFHKIADLIAVTGIKAERDATKDIKDDSKDYKIDDIDTDPSSSNGPLF